MSILNSQLVKAEKSVLLTKQNNLHKAVNLRDKSIDSYLSTILKLIMVGLPRPLRNSLSNVKVFNGNGGIVPLTKLLLKESFNTETCSFEVRDIVVGAFSKWGNSGALLGKMVSVFNKRMHGEVSVGFNYYHSKDSVAFSVRFRTP